MIFRKVCFKESMIKSDENGTTFDIYNASGMGEA